MPVYGPATKLHLGKGCKLENTLFNTVCGQITLGDYVFFGHNALVLTGTHDYATVNTERQLSDQKYTENHITIEEGVWVASGAIVLGPCTIGKHSVVGAGAVVLPGIYPERSLIVGNPAKVVRTITTNEEHV